MDFQISWIRWIPMRRTDSPRRCWEITGVVLTAIR